MKKNFNIVIQQIADRVFTKTNFVFLIGIQNTLSVITIFSNPLPIPPKTSIGLLTGFSFFIVLFLYIFWKQKKILMNKQRVVVDWLVVGFFLINAISLIVSQYIFEPTNFRLLLIAIIQYAAVRLVDFSNEEKNRLLHMIGIVTVALASISLFQLLFRDQAIIIAKRFLFGDAAYSIARDLGRGRGPQWGNLVISFPFFIGSTLLLKHRETFFNRLYVWLGIFLIPLSFVTSNFRWLTLCFISGVVFYVIMIIRSQLIRVQMLVKVIIPVIVSMVIGIMIASSVFQYNVVDRFLLKEKSRDVVFTLGRLFLYQQAIFAFTASPFVGIGSGNYRFIVDRPVILHYYNYVVGGESEVDVTAREPVSSHNDELTMLAETGILGTGLYVVINYLIVSKLLFSLKKASFLKSKQKIILPLSTLTAVFLFYLIGLFENTAPNNFIYIYFLFAVAINWF